MDARTGIPSFYSIYGTDPTTGLPLFYFDRAPDAVTVFQLLYEKARPALVDTTGATNGLDKIPEPFHQSVIFPMAWDMLALGGGDGRAASELSPRAVEALNLMLSRYQHGKEGLEQLGDRGISDLQMW
jgi:hypothetical protein